ncbi:MAG TPA: CBS domain-containing protein [Myxococcota bacterium]|nr:CBS domain-containing protein [Myxococcota bacterium]
MRQPTVREFMDTVVPSLTADVDIYEAVAFPLDSKVTGAPVLDEVGRVIGIVTEKDMLRLLTIGGVGGPRAAGTVADFMTRDPVTVTPQMNVYYAAGLFLHHDFRRLPVVSGDRDLVGAITRFDILRAIRARALTS